MRNHLSKRTAERGIDSLSLNILRVFGERLGRREGLVLKKEMYLFLKNMTNLEA